VIVRILGEGQLQVDDSLTGELNELDAKLEAAVNSGDEPAFKQALDALLGRVRLAGTPVPADMLAPSDLIMPQADATRDDVRKLMTDDGLIPG
jgi:hypothetical protein